MTPPYTASPTDAVMIAQSSLGAVLTAVVWRRPLRPWPATAFLLAAIWLAVSVPIEPEVMHGMGMTLAPDHVLRVLELSTLLACVAMLFAAPRWIAIVALAMKYGLGRFSRIALDSNAELASLHIVCFALLLALHHLVAPRARVSPARTSPVTSFARQDVAIFLVATTLASIVCVYVLHEFCNSGDEWADTYQAQLFAHFKAYGPPPPCPSLFENYWVFLYQGRMFAQYTPGWPLVMAPFQRLGVVWLAAPVTLGATSVACARLARRASRGLGEGEGAERRAVAAAGWIAALLTMGGASMLLSAGSRYPHVMVCACFAWSVESLAVVSARRPAGPSHRAEWVWGAALGSAAALMLSARPTDGAALGVGLFLYFAYALARGRIGLRTVLATTLAFAFWAGLTLVILRLQLGEWWKTGYSIASGIRGAWAKPVLAMPKPDEWKVGAPLGTGSYCWWPCAPALGAAGLLVALRGRGRGSALMLGCGALVLTALYLAVEFGTKYNPGYGPRFHLPVVVPMAVGGAVLLAPLWASGRRVIAGALEGRPLSVGGPAAVAILALVFGTLRIAPLIYPEARVEVYKRSAPFRAIEREQIHHAVVTIDWHGDTFFDPLDLTQNLPLVPDPDVLVLLARHGPQEDACWRDQFGDRYVYRAVGMEESELIPVTSSAP